jgi:hypothetical protein
MAREILGNLAHLQLILALFAGLGGLAVQIFRILTALVELSQ